MQLAFGGVHHLHMLQQKRVSANQRTITRHRSHSRSIVLVYAVCVCMCIKLSPRVVCTIAEFNAASVQICSRPDSWLTLRPALYIHTARVREVCICRTLGMQVHCWRFDSG